MAANMKSEDLGTFIEYIDNSFNARPHGDSFWIDELGNCLDADTGFAEEWWIRCMKPELLRVFGRQGIREHPAEVEDD